MNNFNYPDILPLPSLPSSFPHSVYDDSQTWYQELVNIIEYCNDIGNITNDMRSWLDEFIKTYGEKNNEVLNQIFNAWSKTPKTIEILKKGVFNDLMIEIDSLKNNKMDIGEPIHWAQIGNDVREHIDGTGSGNLTAIVTGDNVAEKTLSRSKLNFYGQNTSLNKFDKYNVQKAKSLSNGMNVDTIERAVSDYISITNGATNVYVKTTGKIAFYDVNKNFIQQNQSLDGMNIPDTAKYLKVDLLLTNLDKSYVGFKQSPYVTPLYEDEFLSIKNNNMDNYYDRYATILYSDNIRQQKSISIINKKLVIPVGTLYIISNINGQINYNNLEIKYFDIVDDTSYLLVYDKSENDFKVINAVDRKLTQVICGFINKYILKMVSTSMRNFASTMKLSCNTSLLPTIDWENKLIVFKEGDYTGYSTESVGGYHLPAYTYAFDTNYFIITMDMFNNKFLCLTETDLQNVDITSLSIIGYCIPVTKFIDLNINGNEIKSYASGNLISEYRYPNVFQVDYKNSVIKLKIVDPQYPWFVETDDSPKRYPVTQTEIQIGSDESPQVMYYDINELKLKFIGYLKYLNVSHKSIYLGKVTVNAQKHYLNIKVNNGALDNIIKGYEGFSYDGVIVNAYNKVKPIIDYTAKVIKLPKLRVENDWNWIIYKNNNYSALQLSNKFKDVNGDVVIPLLDTPFQYLVYDIDKDEIMCLANTTLVGSNVNYIKLGIIMVFSRISYLNFLIDNIDLYNAIDNSGGNSSVVDLEKNNIVIFGDSLSTYNGASENTNPSYPTFYPNGDIDNINKTWWKPIFNKYGNKCYNASLSGGCLTNIIPTTKNGNQILNETILPTTPNVLLFMYGTNDYGRGVTSEVFNQALETFVQTARNKWSGVIIYICSYPFNKRMYDGVVVNSENVTTWSEAVENKAKSLGCKTIDILNVGNNSNNWNLFNIGDGIHYNAKGAKLIKNNIIQQVAEFN